jgi:hypothetical protein
MKKLAVFGVCLSILFSSVFSSNGQTYNGGGGHINDDGSDNFFPLTVSGLSPAMMDSAYGLETVCINLTHTWDDDLVISLISPSGTEFLLSGRHGWDGDNYTNTCFNQNASTHISNGNAPFTGTFIPDGSIASVNNGQNGNGTWQLHILDVYAYADEGDVISWSLTFGPDPAQHFPFFGSFLPIVKINGGGMMIPNDPKIMVIMSIINNGSGLWNDVNDTANEYYGWIGIELRGQSSQNMPKKSYNLETRFPDSTDFVIPLLGMPSESDWLMLANYSDKTQMRNFFSYHMYNKTGRYAPRMRYCELVLDDEYQGIYLLGEKIKRDGDRVDVYPMNWGDTTQPTITGGYIFKVDWLDGGDVTWESDFTAIGASHNLTYVLDYPKPEDVQNAQLKYINAVVDTFEKVMDQPYFADPIQGYRKYIDEDSFIDYILLNEFTKNVDAYRLSTFLHKDRGGKICAGPPWDYDLSWGNADYMEGWDPTGFCYQIQIDFTDQCPFWWERFFEDTLFTNKLRCRWEELRQTIYNPLVIRQEMDSIVNMLGDAIDRNFTKWPILGIYVWPNPAPIPSDYPGEIQKIKNWLDMRIDWLDANLPGYCDYTGQQEKPIIQDLDMSVYPNPANKEFAIRGYVPVGPCHATLLNMNGQIVSETDWDGFSRFQIPEGVSEGLYVLNLYDDLGITTVKVQIHRN